ncbi:MAG: ornithine cyclodeaminase family protein [Streptosporangiales bacterium]|nr:ornithine cyclodeaminase family protein [Streptosporangiales bacterium]
MTLLLTEDDVTAVVTYEGLHAAMERALGDWHRAGVQHHPRVRVSSGGAGLNVLAGADAVAGYVGVKAYGARGGGRDHIVLLYGDTTGDLEAVVAARELGALRTGVASAVATRHLHGDTTVLGLVGSGQQAVTQALALASDNPGLAEIRVASRTPENRERCAAELADRLRGHGCAVSAVYDTAPACDGADVVCTATTSAVPVLDSGHVAPGTHVNAAGSNSLTRVEIDPALVRRSAVVVDSRDQARLEAGDLLAHVESGRLDWRQLPELGEVVAGTRGPLPVSAETDLTLFESLGIGIFDVTAAAFALAEARERGLGTRIDLS